MPPYFSPLSADEPTLKGLSKYEALNLICCKIKHAIKQHAPPRPDRQLTHNPLYKETGPWLCLGTGPLDQKDAGHWYQIVCFLNHTSHHDSSSKCFPVSAQLATLQSCNFSPHALMNSIHKALSS